MLIETSIQNTLNLKLLKVKTRNSNLETMKVHVIKGDHFKSSTDKALCMENYSTMALVKAGSLMN